MAVPAISTTHPAASPMPDLCAAAPAPGGSQAFTQLLDNYLRDVNDQQLQAEKVVENFVVGKTDNIHQVMLALSQADLTFRMALEVRNKAIDAYQEIMRTPL